MKSYAAKILLAMAFSASAQIHAMESKESLLQKAPLPSPQDIIDTLQDVKNLAHRAEDFDVFSLTREPFLEIMKTIKNNLDYYKEEFPKIRKNLSGKQTEMARLLLGAAEEVKKFQEQARDNALAQSNTPVETENPREKFKNLFEFIKQTFHEGKQRKVILQDDGSARATFDLILTDSYKTLIYNSSGYIEKITESYADYLGVIPNSK